MEVYCILISWFLTAKTGRDVNSDWLADQLDERGGLGHAQIHKRKKKSSESEPILHRLESALAGV